VSTVPTSPLAERLPAAGLDWIVPEWTAPSGVAAFVTTRSSASDSRGGIEQRTRGFIPAAPRWLRQVHGIDVAVHRAQDASVPVVADAAITRERGVVCAVEVADCLPVLFADRAGTAVGAAHAGWRGLAAGVLERTVDRFDAGGVRPAELVAWLGPAIGPAAFEVGADVRDAFLAHDPRAEAHFARGAPGKWHADLYALARQRLAERGVDAVSGGGWCTKTDPRFHSWRRDRGNGRMAALIWLE
jgi:YfiH family protein